MPRRRARRPPDRRHWWRSSFVSRSSPGRSTRRRRPRARRSGPRLGRESTRPRHQHGRPRALRRTTVAGVPPAPPSAGGTRMWNSPSSSMRANVGAPTSARAVGRCGVGANHVEQLRRREGRGPGGRDRRSVSRDVIGGQVHGHGMGLRVEEGRPTWRRQGGCSGSGEAAMTNLGSARQRTALPS